MENENENENEKLEENPAPILVVNPDHPEVTVRVGEGGRLMFCGEFNALRQIMGVIEQAPVPMQMPVATQPPAKPKPAKVVDPNKFYAVFYDEQNQVVHTTKQQRLWSEARNDAKSWIGKHGQKAKTVIIYQGDTQAANRGSKMERARTAWHNVE